MRSFSSLLALCSLLVTSVVARPAAIQRRDVDPTLVPEFGHPAGLNPTGTGDCDGITNAAGQVVKIPCFCPPDRNEFLQALNANVNAGRAVNNPSVAVSFPTDSSKASQLERMQTALVTLQNMRGPGVGCPAAATTFLAQLRAIQDAPEDAPAPVTPAPEAPAPAPPGPPAAGAIDPALIPDLGHQAGLNPTGTGDCDGVPNANGQVVKIPCSCPPDRATFIAALTQNVAEGRAVNNPSVAVSFPTDDSNESKAARIIASLITLQNLNGPGLGCPGAATTLPAQLRAVQG
ncbi:hypothetical protein E4U52_001234 [Claviceps spartinae]|uniref:Uncharacterized protein n=1 Tax=Coprinopsis cinerea (strain Okayama-7 / 130 / ATCC MYA-4618 / FGSC 9003) TaxID=240176 RepID=A8NRC1_COPC7|nr:hypothetical protein CC1G_07172 [Coprinopsis cinerea okayama7\|eukprot:XP_001835748.1 hypothetical protein CC1G_07172 [Coprinopsis cinerea okayama7\